MWGPQARTLMQIQVHRQCCSQCSESSVSGLCLACIWGVLNPLCTLHSWLVYCMCTAGCQTFQKGPVDGWNNLFFVWAKFFISVDNICSQFSIGNISSLLFCFCLCLCSSWLEMAFNSEVFYICLISSMVFGSEGLFQLSCGFDNESRMFVEITSHFLLP